MRYESVLFNLQFHLDKAVQPVTPYTHYKYFCTLKINDVIFRNNCQPKNQVRGSVGHVDKNELRTLTSSNKRSKSNTETFSTLLYEVIIQTQYEKHEDYAEKGKQSPATSCHGRT